MDRFVIRGEKRCGENSDGTRENKKKSRSISSEGRRVLEEWKNQFAVSERDGEPFCLLCSKILGVCKMYNVKRHFDTTHVTFDKKYLPGSQERAHKITSLEKNAIAEQNTMRAIFKCDPGRDASDIQNFLAPCQTRQTLY
ncbi:hypothetical protein QQF64_026183 [Cirrhinus molitorella]|uniref:SPIN-DOC-like zinc-finger domain-containing protein n=1 Tax=Cirrhinus molitorella TaxID=172907 RepID=A0ABR3NR53_9TELE